MDVILPKQFDRYAVYFTPSGAWADAGASWLGWDIRNGRPASQPDNLPFNIHEVTKRPRKYGFHGTIKPPLVLADGTTASKLRDSVNRLCADLRPVTLDGAEVARLGPFLALKLVGIQSQLSEMAARVVRDLDRFRAPPSEEEIVRRKQVRLTPAQDQHLQSWGYPYVMDQFQFHMTLTGPLSLGVEVEVQQAAEEHFGPHLPEPFVMDSLTLVGQAEDGMFYQIERFRLGA